MADQYLFYATVGLLGLLVLCWVGNLVLLGLRNKPSVWLGRLVYVCGMLCTVCNAVRMARIYEQYRGMFILANVIAFVCIFIAFLRAEKGRGAQREEEKTESERPE